MKINSQLSKEYFDLGIESFENSNFVKAEEYFRLSLKYYPGRISILDNLSASLIKLNKYDEAQKLISYILSVSENNPITHLNNGNIYLKLHKLDDALSEFLLTKTLNPNYPEAFNNYAFVLQRLGHYEQAIVEYDNAINLNNDYVEAMYNKTHCLIQLNKYSEAILLIEKALKINNRYDDLYLTYINLKQLLCEWNEFERSTDKLLYLINSNVKVSSVFCLLSLYDDPDLHLKETIKYSNLEFPIDNSLGPISFSKNNKVKIGYFSADFHNHATAYLIAQLFELHDKNRFEIHAFSYGPNKQDKMRKRIETSVDYFHEVSILSDTQIAQLSRTHNIDISIDLKGYTFGCRPGIFSKITAPIQVNYLGYPGSLGAQYFDYIIADHILIPENAAQFYTEKIVYLPNSYQVNDSTKSISNVVPNKEKENLPLNCFVFCCFNNVYKILPNIFSIWMEILKHVDNSVLWLLEENPVTINNLIYQANLNGISSERLIFAKREKLEYHLSRHQLADLFLDTFPYNAHTTSSDALWAGLPVLTCIGNSFASRVTSSLLTAINIPELITDNFINYKNKAIELALDPDKLLKIKKRIINNRMIKPLFDCLLFTNHLEKAYLEMYQTYIESKPKRNIIIK